MVVVNLAEKLAMVRDHWSPKVIGSFNGHDLMVVKAEGEFVWHAHADTDDFFLVLKGRLEIEMREGSVALTAGELYVVPAGIEHRTVAREEVHLLLIEPHGTPNTGNEATAARKGMI